MRAHACRLLLVLLAASLGAEAGTLRLGARRYTDESSGFAVYLPEKWERIPTKFQEVTILGKWAGRPRRGVVPPEAYVLKFVPRGGDDPDAPEAPGGPMGIPGFGALEGQPHDLWEFLTQRMVDAYEIVADEAEFKTSDKSIRAHFKVFREKLEGAPGDRRGGAREAAGYQGLVVAAQYERREGADALFGLLFITSVAEEEDMRPAFETAIKRFRLLDPAEEAAAEEGEEGVSDADLFVDSESKPEAWREIRKKKLIPGWTALDTTNYLIVYNQEVKRPLVKAIAQQIEAIREQVYRVLFPPAKEVKAISVVRVCKDAAEYHKYGGPGGSAGYWSPGDEELVFYQDKSNKSDSLRVLYHEAFHQYIHYAVGNVAPHSWFNEGHGDYFAGHNYRAKKFESDVFRWRTGIIANALSSRQYVKLREFLKYTQAQYYARPGLCYAQGWSFVYFLREVERRKMKKYQSYWGLLDKYFDAIKANVREVRDGGLYGLEEPPPPPPPDVGPDGTAPEPKQSALPPIPGLDTPFPGEHPEAGTPPELPRGDSATETRTTAGGRSFRGGSVDAALDAAVDEAFQGIDLEQLEKDWIEFSK